MKVRDLMTVSPATCEPTTSLQVVAQMMVDHQCAAIPVTHAGRVIGIVTDRDIACRGVALHGDVSKVDASCCMTAPVIAISADEHVDRAIAMMEENVLHHLPVIDQDGLIVGIVAQSDLGRRMTNREFGALARMTSIRSRYSRSFVQALVKTDH
jgi:CBS domain-containing protein